MGKWNPLFGSVEIAVKVEFLSPRLMLLNAEKNKIIEQYPIAARPKDDFCKDWPPFCSH